ncbi:sel1 repeat family protein (plasmid) [Photobacterium damselae]|uniref:tetratricopeptide repeat protein n=1 Tax=Photobacterium damselae TaxID=38293 RepID=UPI002543A16E
MGNAAAQYILGGQLDNGSFEGYRNVNFAIHLFRKSAEQGYSDAQTILGLHYLIGDIVPENRSLALGYFLEAAKQGDNLAQVRSGTIYLRRCNLEKGESCKKAYYWLSEAVKNGNSEAKNELKKCVIQIYAVNILVFIT